MNIIFIFILSLVFSTCVYAQQTGIKYNNDRDEYLLFLNDSIIDYRIVGNHRGTVATKYRGTGFYTVKDSLIVIKSFFSETIQKFDIHKENVNSFGDSLAKFIFIDYYDLFGSTFYLSFYSNDEELERIEVPKDKEVAFNLNKKFDSIYIHYVWDSLKLSKNDIKGQIITIEYRDCAIESEGIKQYYLKKINDTTINLVGPIIPHYKKLNRKRFFSSFLTTYPWKWSFRKQQWYSPRERLLYLEKNKEKK